MILYEVVMMVLSLKWLSRIIYKALILLIISTTVLRAKLILPSHLWNIDCQRVINGLLSNNKDKQKDHLILKVVMPISLSEMECSQLVPMFRKLMKWEIKWQEVIKKLLPSSNKWVLVKMNKSISLFNTITCKIPIWASIQIPAKILQCIHLLGIMHNIPPLLVIIHNILLSVIINAKTRVYFKICVWSKTAKKVYKKYLPLWSKVKMNRYLII